jgi:hypothetical protein
MTDKSDSSGARVLSVLDLFSDQRLLWTPEAIADALQVSLPTAYRYVKLLTEAGLLQRTLDAQLTLGPRIIVLDHYIRQADPVLQHGVPFMKELVSQTGLDCVVSALYGGQLLDTHREFGAAPASLSYGRGRPGRCSGAARPRSSWPTTHRARCTSCSTPGRPRSRPPGCPSTGRGSGATTPASARPASTCRSASSKHTWRRWPRRCSAPTAVCSVRCRWWARCSAWR